MKFMVRNIVTETLKNKQAEHHKQLRTYFSGFMPPSSGTCYLIVWCVIPGGGECMSFYCLLTAGDNSSSSKALSIPVLGLNPDCPRSRIHWL